MRPKTTHPSADPDTAGTALWVQLVPPGVDDERVRLPQPATGLLPPAIRRLCLEYTPGFTVDILAYLGPRYEQYFLKATGSKTDTRHVSTVNTLSDEIVTAVTGENGNLGLGVTAQALMDTLPDRIGIDIASLDMRPVGWQPTTTLRIVGTGQQPIRQWDRGDSFGSYLQALHTAGVPHVARLRINPLPDGNLQIRQQVLLCGDAAETLTPSERCSIFGPDTTVPATVYEREDVTTTLALFRDADLRIRAAKEAPQGPWLGAKTTRAEVLTAAVTHGAEYTWVLTGADTDSEQQVAYDQIDATPTLTVAPSALASVLGYAPNYGGCDWSTAASGTRQQPVGTRHRRLQEPVGTESGSTSRQRPDRQRATPGGQSSTAGIAWRRFHEHGDTLAVPSEYCPHVAFTRSPATGTRQPVVVATEGVPAGGLVALGQAPDDGITVVTETVGDAQRAYRLGRMPVRPDAAPRSWVGLYTHPTAPVSCDGALAVIPADNTCTWQLNADGAFRLVSNESVLARGRSTAGITDLTAAIRWVQPTDSGCTLFETDGTVLAAESQPATIGEQYQPLYWPVVPQHRCFQDALTAFVVPGNRLRYVEPTVPRSDESRFSGAEIAFLKRHTRRTHDGTKPLDVGQIEAAARAFCRPDPNCALPTRKGIAEAIETLNNRKITVNPVFGESDTSIGRRWRWPTQAEPPFEEVVGPPTPAVVELARTVKTVRSQ